MILLSVFIQMNKGDNKINKKLLRMNLKFVRKLFFLLTSAFLLAGCAESVVAIGGGATNGKLAQSSIQTVASYGVKKTTGKTPMQHALHYADEKKHQKNKKGLVAEKKNRYTLSPRGKAFAEARKEKKDTFIFKGKIYNTRFKDKVAEKTIKPKNLISVKKKNNNKELIKNKKSIMELALDVQAALNNVR